MAEPTDAGSEFGPGVGLLLLHSSPQTSLHRRKRELLNDEIVTPDEERLIIQQALQRSRGYDDLELFLARTVCWPCVQLDKNVRISRIFRAQTCIKLGTATERTTARIQSLPSQAWFFEL